MACRTIARVRRQPRRAGHLLKAPKYNSLTERKASWLVLHNNVHECNIPPLCRHTLVFPRRFYHAMSPQIPRSGNEKRSRMCGRLFPIVPGCISLAGPCFAYRSGMSQRQRSFRPTASRFGHAVSGAATNKEQRKPAVLTPQQSQHCVNRKETGLVVGQRKACQSGREIIGTKALLLLCNNGNT